MFGFLTVSLAVLAYVGYGYMYRQAKINTPKETTSKILPFTQSDSYENFEKPSDKDLKSVLTELQYYVTQEDGTEKSFDNAYWDNHEDGIYVDVISGEPLFSSRDKFDSGTGWPSFLKPIEGGVVTEHDDFKLTSKRIEIRSKYGDNHIGHIIMDGPLDNKGIRYCMNSAAMRFIPLEQLEEQGYVRYVQLFR